jgi:hypothetical protein
MVAVLASLAFIAGGTAPAFSQFVVNDGTARGTCTNASFANGSLTLSPAGCIAPVAPNAPVFSFAAGGLATASESQALAAGGAFNISYTVNLNRNGNTDPLAVVVEACASGTGCTARANKDFYLDAGFQWAPPYTSTLSFAPGDTVKTFTVAVADNLVADGDRVLSLKLSNPTAPGTVGTPSVQNLTITDNEPAATVAVSFDTAAPAVFETAGLAYFGITRASGAGAASVRVEVQASGTAPTSNYTTNVPGSVFTGSPASIWVDFANGETQKGVYLGIVDDTVYTGTRTVVLALKNPVNLVLGPTATTTLTIYDNESPPSQGEVGTDGLPIATLTAAQFSAPGANLCYLGVVKPGGNSGPCGASPVTVSTCGSGMNGAITGAYQINLTDYPAERFMALHIPIPKGNAYSIKFRTPSQAYVDAQPGGVDFNAGFSKADTTLGTPSQAFLTVTPTRCDFNYVQTDLPNGCYKGNGAGDVSVTTRVLRSGSTSPPSQTTCDLLPDTDYYFNLRWEYAGSPPYGATTANRGIEACTSGVCGAVIRFD